VQQHLRHVTAGTNRLAPPLPYADGQFDFVYALSVFTHLTLELEAAWLVELERVVKPGGVLLVTLQGDRYRHKFTAAEAAAYDAGQAVVRQESLAGTNWCATFHPRAYVERVFAARLELLRYDVGAMPGVLDQDVVVLRKIDSASRAARPA
jgi:SAM-dependent methyltransferase